MIKSWSDDAWIEYEYWQTQDKRTLKRINLLIKDIERGHSHGENPLNGIGEPEYLKGDLNGYMSRKINEKDRLVYAIRENNNLFISSCRGHYDDT